jgi:hypothetical protein
MFDREHILSEIKRTAVANGGTPLGKGKFETETGIRPHQWGKYWARWGEALAEAGFAPNTLIAPISDTTSIEALVKLIREIKRFPAFGDLVVKRARDPDFPSEKVYRRFGGQATLAKRVLQYCQEREGYDDVATLCVPRANEKASDPKVSDKTTLAAFGHVYLLRSGRYYKIGKTNAVGRRERELALRMPEPASVVHSIKTDDPSGIEAYWHGRFADKRKGGEWFDLTAVDVRAFKLRKFM